MQSACLLVCAMPRLHFSLSTLRGTHTFHCFIFSCSVDVFATNSFNFKTNVCLFLFVYLVREVAHSMLILNNKTEEKIKFLRENHDLKLLILLDHPSWFSSI